MGHIEDSGDILQKTCVTSVRPLLQWFSLVFSSTLHVFSIIVISMISNCCIVDYISVISEREAMTLSVESVVFCIVYTRS